MEAGQKQVPKVYLFQKDYDMIEELLRDDRATEETGGDLFGLWTTKGEPVLHIITGQGKETQQTNAKFERLEALLHRKFHLSYIGQWQYKRRSEQKEMAIIGVVGQDYLRKNAKHRDTLVMMVDYDDPLKKLRLAPYFLSQFSNITEGESEPLSGESVFRSDEEVKYLVDELVRKRDLNAAENKSDPFNSSPRKVAHGPTEKGKTDTPPTENADVDMEDVSTSHENGTSWRTVPMPLARGQADFACNQSGFKVYLFKEDKKMMEDLVLRYQDLETGGDLFGLWNGEGDAVIHIVLGPGKDCKRTDVSFYQDIPYLQRNGELLTHKYMLCHIGEWHSHHQLRLFQPSRGDSTTVIRNYPPGTCGFLLIIANIVSSTEVELSPYLYTANSHYSFDQKGELVLLPHANAFKTDLAIQKSMKEGKETETDRRYASYQGYSTGYSRSIKERPNYNTHPSSSTAGQFEHKSKNRSKQR